MNSLKIAIFIFFCGIAVEVHGQIISIAGKITDAKYKPLAFANVYIKGSSIGTVSNDLGEFEIQLPANTHDTLIVSFIGLERQYLRLDNLSLENQLMVVLNEQALKLEEITINSSKLLRNANSIVKLAIEQIKSSSSKNGHILKGYYRHSNEQDGQYRQLIEAAITVFDPGDTEQSPKFSIDQIRRSHDLREVYDRTAKKGVVATTDEMQRTDKQSRSLTLDCWYKNNFKRPISSTNKYGINSCGALDFGQLNSSFIKEHNFKLDTITTFENDYVYVIKVLPSSSSKPYYTFPDRLIIPIGKLYIRTDDFGILKMEYQYILNPKKRGSDDFETTYRVFGSGIIFQVTAIYKEFDGNMYLSYLNSKHHTATSVADRKNRGANSNKVYNLTERSFLVNQIVTDAVDVNATFIEKNWDGQLYKESYSYDENFWRDFIVMTETSEQKKLRSDLEKKVSLDEQFKKIN